MPAPAPQPGAKKSKLPMLAAVFAVLSIVFVGISLALPWYSYKTEMSAGSFGSGSVEVQFTFAGEDSKTDMTFMGQTISASNHTAWADVNATKTKALYQQTMIITILGLVMGILLLVGAVMIMKGPSKKKLAVVFGVLAFVFCMIAPVTFMAMHPGAVKDDSSGATGDGPWSSFTGSTDSAIGKITWGPSIGWIMALMGFIFALLGFILVMLVKGTPEAFPPQAAPAGAPPQPGAMPPMGQMPPPPQQPGYAPPPPPPGYMPPPPQ